MREKMTKRRAKGDGSVYLRKDGRCIGEYLDALCKKRYISGKTKAEVMSKLRQAIADKDVGIAYDSENLIVGLYLERWLDSIQPTVRESTWERYESLTPSYRISVRQGQARQTYCAPRSITLSLQAGCGSIYWNGSPSARYLALRTQAGSQVEANQAQRLRNRYPTKTSQD
jgi:hypothetical protein